MLGDAINRLIKFSLKSLKEKISYAHLMCGEYGLVHALINIFSFGYELYLQTVNVHRILYIWCFRFKSARLFGRNLCVWDFFLKVTMDFNQSIAHHLQASSAANQGSSGCRIHLKCLCTGCSKCTTNARLNGRNLPNVRVIHQLVHCPHILSQKNRVAKFLPIS